MELGSAAYQVFKDLKVPLRDGTLTGADLYLPTRGPSPVVVVCTPYDKNILPAAVDVAPNWGKLAERGYAVLVQDTRGRFSSEGEFTPFVHEAADGFDTIEWTAAQSWCDGNVAILGASYFGATTMLASTAHAPHLRCAVPLITPDDYYSGWCYQSGALELFFLGGWASGLVAASAGSRRRSAPAGHGEVAGADREQSDSMTAWPVAAFPGLDEQAAPYWQEWLRHPARDAFWDAISVAGHLPEVAVPMLHVTGWFDVFQLGALRSFAALTAAGRAPQKLIVGPWAHTSYGRFLGDVDCGPFGAANAAGVIADINRWLDVHVRRREGVRTGPAVRYFLLGANQWRTADSWPPEGARPVHWYLHSAGSANSAFGDGSLAPERPEAEEPADRFLYDPARPVPTTGGNLLIGNLPPGPLEQSGVERRDDVLVYTSEPLSRNLTVTGPIALHLEAATDGPDTDWTGRLCDVHPDGRSIGVCDGILRARYRASFRAPQQLEPNKAYGYDLELGATAWVFRRGHRLRLQVSSSNFPRFDRNSNTGRDIAHETGWRVAAQRVEHSAARPSFLTLPVLGDS